MAKRELEGGSMGALKFPRRDINSSTNLTIETAIAAAQEELRDARLSDLSALLAAATLPFPRYLPTQYPYTETSFYVRDCYATYYNYIIETFSGKKRGITVSGTQGIGKSLFMAYVFLRFRLEYPQATIVVESYGKTSRLMKVLVWQNGTICEYLARDVAAMDRLLAQYSSGSSLNLMDGPPDERPDGVPRFVVFTSPNEDWKAKTWKDSTLRLIYMPVWDLDELRDAAQVLELKELLKPVDEEEIRHLGLDSSESQDLSLATILEARSYVFGRVARGCLLLIREDVKQLRLQIEDAISAFDRRIRSASVRAPTRDERHRLCHYFLRDPAELTECYADVASLFVARRLQKRMDALDEAKQRDFESLLLGDAATSSSAGFVLVRRAHKMLARGVRIEARPLSEANEASPARQLLPTTFVIEKSVDVSTVSTNFTLATLASGPYFIPVSKNLAAIDSFYFQKGAPDDRASASVDKPRVLLFQATVSMAHPVNGEGIVHVLTRLGLWDGSTIPSAALIFIVPESHASTFRRQPVEMADAVTGQSHILQVKGIGKGLTKALKILDIETVSQLEASIRADSTVAMAKAALARHKDHVEAAGDVAHGILEAIPQFLWGI